LVVSDHIDIQAPIEETFEWVSNPEKQKRWLDHLIHTEYLDTFTGENPVGVRFRQRMRQGGQTREYEGEIIEYYPPNLFGIRLNLSDLAVEQIWRLEPLTRRSCRLHYKCEIMAENLVSAAKGLLFHLFTRLSLKKQLLSLKRCAENGKAQGV
jgi:hypothetical protein